MSGLEFFHIWMFYGLSEVLPHMDVLWLVCSSSTYGCSMACMKFFHIWMFYGLSEVLPLMDVVWLV